MKRWIQISIISVLIACVVNIGYLNHKVVDFRRDIIYTQRQTTFHLDSLYNYTKTKDNCLYDQIAKTRNNLYGQLNILENAPTVSKIVDSVINSVVYIEIKGKYQDPQTGELADASYYGTGFVYDTEGHILTAGHVVGLMQQFQNPVMTVTCYYGKQFKVIGTSYLWDPNLSPGKTLDIGLIKIDTEGIELKPVELGLANPRLGETLISIGNPAGFRFSVTAGIVSRIGILEDGMEHILLQTDTATNPGNSGGPLFGMDGRVYGITTFVRSTTDSGIPCYGLNFAVPISVVNENIQQLLEELDVWSY